MTRVLSVGVACDDCTLIIANDDDSGIADAAAHRARMADYGSPLGYLVITDPIISEDRPCSVCGGEILPVGCTLNYDGTNAHGIAILMD